MSSTARRRPSCPSHEIGSSPSVGTSTRRRRLAKSDGGPTSAPPTGRRPTCRSAGCTSLPKPTRADPAKEDEGRAGHGGQRKEIPRARSVLVQRLDESAQGSEKLRGHGLSLVNPPGSLLTIITTPPVPNSALSPICAGIRDERIHCEALGPSTLRRDQPPVVGASQTAKVAFARSSVSIRAGHGSLPDAALFAGRGCHAQLSFRRLRDVRFARRRGAGCVLQGAGGWAEGRRGRDLLCASRGADVGCDGSAGFVAPGRVGSATTAGIAS